MSRPIKFMAWHKADKKMYKVTGFTQNQWLLRGKSFPMPQGAVEILQYTGRNTYGESEIYQGNILYFTVFDHNGSDKQYKGVVEWSDESCAFIISVGHGESYWLYWVLDQDDEVEIIGNIYENPELLKGEGTNV